MVNLVEACARATGAAQRNAGGCGSGNELTAIECGHVHPPGRLAFRFPDGSGFVADLIFFSCCYIKDRRASRFSQASIPEIMRWNEVILFIYSMI
jgi:hypothetical protein